MPSQAISASNTRAAASSSAMPVPARAPAWRRLRRPRSRHSSTTASQRERLTAPSATGSPASRSTCRASPARIRLPAQAWRREGGGAGGTRDLRKENEQSNDSPGGCRRRRLPGRLQGREHRPGGVGEGAAAVHEIAQGAVDGGMVDGQLVEFPGHQPLGQQAPAQPDGGHHLQGLQVDRKSTRLNSSHVRISYAVFCLKKKNKKNKHIPLTTALLDADNM